MNDRLKIINDLKKLIPYVNGVICDFPKREVVLRDKIMDACYCSLEFAYFANESKEYFIREEYQKRILVKLKMLDFYFRCSFRSGYIEGKRYGKISHHLLIIVKEVYGWIKSDTYNRGKKEEIFYGDPRYRVNAFDWIRKVDENEKKDISELNEKV